MNKVSAIVLKKATAAAAAVASRSHVTSSSLKNKNGYARSLFVLMDKFEGSVTMDEADYSFPLPVFDISNMAEKITLFNCRRAESAAAAGNL